MMMGCYIFQSCGLFCILWWFQQRFQFSNYDISKQSRIKQIYYFDSKKCFTILCGLFCDNMSHSYKEFIPNVIKNFTVFYQTNTVYKITTILYLWKYDFYDLLVHIIYRSVNFCKNDWNVFFIKFRKICNIENVRWTKEKFINYRNEILATYKKQLRLVITLMQSVTL